MNEFLKAMDFRHACKEFDSTKEIPNEQFRDILESGRMSPSSFGLEQTRFLVIRDKKLKEKLREACWNQVQITSCSELVVLKSLLQCLVPPSNYIDMMSYRRGKSDEERKKWIGFFAKAFEEKERSRRGLESWSVSQAFIAASSMMNCAAFMGIDSCPIEGFEVERVNKILGIDSFKERVALILPFGYRVREQQNRYRLSLDELVEYR